MNKIVLGVIILTLIIITATFASEISFKPTKVGRTEDKTIGYQIHSWDDLREWDSMFQKIQTRTETEIWLKVDFSYINENRSKLFPNCYSPSNNGCFPMIHDSPIEGNFYNTSYDLLQFISSPKNIDLFRNPNFNVFIAVCFKFDNPCLESTPDAQSWLFLVDEFFRNATQIIDSNSLNLQFILDGASTPGGAILDLFSHNLRICLAEKWRPLNATYISSNDPLEAIYSNEKNIFGFDRFQILNQEILSESPLFYVDFIMDLGYAKFNESIYPFLFWEPSDQVTINTVQDALLSGIPHSPGFQIRNQYRPYSF
ncbi:hypothetical protein M0811_00863 [Anaeramoeba ignava]|uniref:Uncharacterized protein n=1 Tax=Anaeramoeba ignava TaxID=1746090 RepID=A0A9Q0RD06_ANAIG|nr:hypothetical protein M0811_00863 [Anaeramoeba ignava]